MCGFLTYLSATGDAAAQAPAIGTALESLRHRGPDARGLYVDGDDAVLGFQRLAIIDVRGSDQPMHYLDRYVVTFNGEIYNYEQLRTRLVREHGAVFRTLGDTEVVLAGYHYWGPAVVAALRGMFAFVIWDRLTRTAFAARDRFGIKPLHYAVTHGGTYFASEPKALLPFVGAAVDRVSLAHYLTFQYVPEPGSMHRGVRSLRPGECATLSERRLTVSRYWRPEFRPVSEPRAATYDRIRAALTDSVAAHMRADVPVGAFLSGGIDSTAVVALARQHNPNLLTFTAGLDVDGYSEVEQAAASAQALGVRHHSVLVTAEMMMEALPRIVWHLDDPVADPALVPLFYVARLARRHVTVALSGEGADELFAGYGIYREPYGLAVFRAMPSRLRRGLRTVAGAIPEGVRGRSFLERGGTTIEERYVGNARIFTDAQKRQLLRGEPPASYLGVTARLYAETSGMDDIQRMRYIDLATWLPGDILRKADRMSMAHSLEVRVPFLDPAVFAAASATPTRLALPHGTRLTKVALRRALRDLVPPGVVARPKLGFPTPIRVWLKGPMYEWADQLLAGSGAGELLDLSYGRGLLRAHRAGEADHSRKIWTLLVFALWHDVFVARAGASVGAADPGYSS